MGCAIFIITCTTFVHITTAFIVCKMDTVFCFAIKVEESEESGTELVSAGVGPPHVNNNLNVNWQPTVRIGRLPPVGCRVALDRDRGSRYNLRRKEKVVIDLT